MSTKTARKPGQSAVTETTTASTPVSAPASLKPAPQPVPAKIFEVALADLTLPEERTKKVVLPTFLYLEADPKTIVKRKGHQVDPSRPASHIGVMPCRRMLEQSGNPYPANGDHETVVTADTWKPYISVAYHVFEVLKERAEVSPSDIYADVQRRVGEEKLTYLEPAVRDALRDLACCGYADALRVGVRKLYRLKAV